MDKIKKKIESYIKAEYGISPAHPWARYPEHETFADPDTKKWFAIIMLVDKKHLGLDGGDAYVMNVKADSELILMLSGTPGYFPGYHMNKLHWLSILLDGSVPLGQIKTHIDRSYQSVTDTPARRIYEAVKKIPAGHVATYAQVAAMAGNPRMSRAVGNALHKNKDPEGVPCFRVVNSKGELAGEFAFGGAGEQAKLLIADGIEVTDGKVDLDKFGMALV